MTNRYHDLLIIDDIYPSSFSPFRTLEYNHYLWFFDAGVLALEGSQLWIENTKLQDHIAVLDVADKYKSRIYNFKENHAIGAKLAYVTFLGNAHRLLPYFTARNLPFILQLYPGGGFAVDQEDTDRKLKEVLLSPLCLKVITTQTITSDYIINKIGCDPDKVEFIFGGVFDSRVDFDYFRDKKIYGKDKETIDICFVAHKYGDDLISKGYDYFVDMAKALTKKFDNLYFHVVGDYSAEDIPLGNVVDKITFYGRQPTAFFADFYPKMDAIISYNRPFVLMPGAFDGFPTGACLEAGFRGVANILNDPLKLNQSYTDGVEILLLDDDFKKSVSKISRILQDPVRLASLGENTWRSFHRTMDLDRQLWLRSKIIGDELQKHRSLIALRASSRSDIDGELLRLATANLRAEITHRDNEIARLDKEAQEAHRRSAEVIEEGKRQQLLAEQRIMILSEQSERWRVMTERLASGIPNRIFEKIKLFVRRAINKGRPT